MDELEAFAIRELIRWWIIPAFAATLVVIWWRRGKVSTPVKLMEVKAFVFVTRWLEPNAQGFRNFLADMGTATQLPMGHAKGTGDSQDSHHVEK